jgi:2-methylcitrate dehydratase PrpD
MAHAMDYDDTQVGTGFHPNVSVVPALLAACDIVPQASGKALLLAHVVGLELCCRMTLAATNRGSHPWITTTLFGVFGAAVAAGKMLGLTQDLLREAVGIAYSSAGGSRQGLLDGALIQRVQPGFSAQAGVTAVQLAQRGVTGARKVLDGRYGLYPSYYGKDHDLVALTRDLGREFRMLDVALKRFPCCSYSQEPIEAALDLVGEHGFGAETVAQATAYVPSAHAAGLVDHPYEPQPLTLYSRAQVDAQFSMQYVIAAALQRKTLGAADFQDKALRDREVAELARRVRVCIDAQQEGKVEIELNDGTRLSRRVPVARGHPQRPFSAGDLLDKLAECARYAAVPRTRAQAVELARAIQDLEAAAQCAQLTRLLA